MQRFGLPFWKRAPFVRALIPLITGILLQFYFGLVPYIIWPVVILALLMLSTPKMVKLSRFYIHRWVPGLGINLLLFALGMMLAYQNNIENDEDWVNKHYHEEKYVIVTLVEPLVEKPKSYKALAKIERVIADSTQKQVKGNLLIYFQKDSVPPLLSYGSQLVITDPLQPIRNSGNPGGFNYKRYCAFQNIYHQVFLKPGDYHLLPASNTNWFDQSLINIRLWVLSTLRKYVKGPDEIAVGEALLIGYRADLDRELVQAYSNAGVVHIIAISGLHLGMIYGVLRWLFAQFKQRRWNTVLKPVIILLVLWMFTFIAGAVPSILRSAVMFTCIVIGDSFSRKTSIYNTLAISAFILLLINPFYLWDVGFQLSFAAVTSIVAFFKPISNWVYFQNKFLSAVWKLSAISLAAQLLTLPIVLYHFHQFPNLFLFTNLLVVPLSGLILFAELLLLIFDIFPFIAELWGRIVEYLIWLMNVFIERTNRIPWSVIDGIQVTIPQSIFIYGMLLFGALWLMRKQKQMFFAVSICLLGYMSLRSIDLIQTAKQQKLIVYNIPQYTAIDIVQGNTYAFYGDSSLKQDGFLRNFHLRPSRILNRVIPGKVNSVSIDGNMITSPGKKIIVVSDPLSHGISNTAVDVMIITGNPRLYIKEILRYYKPGLLVFDATNPLWKIRLWKKDCDSLHLRHYSVPEQGAFEMDI